MSKQFTSDAQIVLARAQVESQAMNHSYIGTEHILLGLLHESPGISIDVLRTFGVNQARVRLEIEKLIHRGPEPIASSQLPFTPRARQTIEFAEQEATFFNQKQVDAEHLLIGIVREADGVAGQILRNLGLNIDKVRQEVLKVRFLQMAIVERAVRPLRASIARKRKMREELLAHLTAIYEEEQVRLHDPYAALNSASQRFGDPVELASEFQKTLPLHERIGYYIERCFGWRAPETAARYLARLATRLFMLMAIAFCAIALPTLISVSGKGNSLWIEMRPAIAFLIGVPIVQFVLGLLYFKIRDAMHGAFGSGKSLPRAFAYATLMAIAIAACGVGFSAMTNWDFDRAAQSLGPFCLAGILGALFYCILARRQGPKEISDVLWACLDV